MPAMMGMIRSGRPTAVATPLMTPTGTVAMYVVNRCWANMRRWMGTSLQEPLPQLLVATSTRGRAGASRSALVSARSSVSSVEIAELLLAEHPGERGADLLA